MFWVGELISKRNTEEELIKPQGSGGESRLGTNSPQIAKGGVAYQLHLFPATRF